ncbi:MULTISPECIES: NAD-binding protein [Sulfurospirillum]|jgi:trk system potassium uptake protein TrkA|uniref:NAD-binding protein n=1 Tax=Sulfurospirillum TaxID=57665 RepID=UPI000543C044|nr:MULTISPECIES: NAD-binding protein [Sulfurospirillum]KHG35194.1 MAG: potassium transporter TrkA [Sulfurospirillum sp. MES]MCD8544171.1 NAD-binding protein [Sulfurospirillum cavolei]MCP3651823.1 NAD-binding protein [Sulfurospirillum sp. DNRA8]MCR1810670.1 NAD-binding protein [Sulfurospirillum sp. DNRA8]
MQVIIAGAGRVGYNIAKHLMHNNSVTVIDQNEYAIHNIQENLDVLGICGNIENPHTYLGINPQVDLFIAVTDSDEVNLLSSLIIDNIATVKRKIIRLKNTFFASDQVKAKLNINETIVPSFEAAQPFKYLVDFSHAHNAKAFKETKALLISIRLKEDFTPRMISTFIGEISGEVAVAGIERQKNFFVPKPVETLLPNDLVYFFAFPNAILSIRTTVCDYNENATPIKNCVIFGADALGVEIAKVLLKKGIDVQIMDKNIELCRKANIELKNKATVLKTTYDADHINTTRFDTDMFIAATKNDEYNITKCIEAKQRGIKKIIGINNDIAYSSLMRNLNIEVVRGEKINAYYSILERIQANDVFNQKKFCGGEGAVLLRKIEATSSLISEKVPLPDRVDDKGHFIILRDNDIFEYRLAGAFQKEDIVVAFTKECDFEVVAKWFQQNLAY